MGIIKRTKAFLKKKVSADNILPVCLVAFAITITATLVVNIVFKLAFETVVI